MKSCEMHLVLVLSDHVNVGKDHYIAPQRPKKPKREEPHKQLYIHMLRHQENSPAKIPRAQKAHLYAFKETFLENNIYNHSTDKRV